MTAVLEARRLGKRYRRRWALADCTLSIPAGYVAGLVGPNGAGKTTLLHLAVGLLRPSAGTIEVLGGVPGSGPGQLARVGFMAQDSPTYPGWSVADHLRFGAKANRSWDTRFAAGRVAELGLDPAQRAGKLSGGQRAQLALTLALAKRPELLILDEPVARLDPLARRGFLQDLQAAATGQQLSVVLSSHLVADLERACDYLIVLAGGRVQLAGEISGLLASHHLLTGPRRESAPVPAGCQVVQEGRAGQQATLLVRAPGPVRDPVWTSTQVSLEDLVLAYMSQAAGHGRNQAAEVTRCSG
jgi:ABC-2 type transport system ATP-binding protein